MARNTDLTDQQRRRFNASLVLRHPKAKAFESAVHATIAANRDRRTHRCVELGGEFHAGKTELAWTSLSTLAARSWQRGTTIRDETHGDVTHERMPVVLFEASATGERHLMEAMAAAMGIPAPIRSERARDILARAVAHCYNAQVEVIAIDEANHLETAGREEHLTQLIKEMLNRIPATLVFIGAGLDQSPIFNPATSRKADRDAAGQISHRVNRVMLDGRPSGAVSRESWWGHLVRVSAGQFLLESSDGGLDLRDVDYRWLDQLCEGRVGDLFMLLTAAAAAAVGDEEAITRSGLRNVHAMLTTGGT